MSDKINKKIAKEIATVIMAIHAEKIDGVAFEDSEYIVDENEQQLIIDEIKKISNDMISKIEKKHNIELKHIGSTEQIVKTIIGIYFDYE